MVFGAPGAWVGREDPAGPPSAGGIVTWFFMIENMKLLDSQGVLI